MPRLPLISGDEFAKAMRRIRIDDARRRNRDKRGGKRAKEPLADAMPYFDQDPTEVLAIEEVLAKLEKTDRQKADIVTMRYFAGLTVDETADALGLAPRTVDREWKFARSWLYRELSSGFAERCGG